MRARVTAARLKRGRRGIALERVQSMIMCSHSSFASLAQMPRVCCAGEDRAGLAEHMRQVPAGAHFQMLKA